MTTATIGAAATATAAIAVPAATAVPVAATTAVLATVVPVPHKKMISLVRHLSNTLTSNTFPADLVQIEELSPFSPRKLEIRSFMLLSTLRRSCHHQGYVDDECMNAHGIHLRAVSRIFELPVSLC